MEHSKEVKLRLLQRTVAEDKVEEVVQPAKEEVAPIPASDASVVAAADSVVALTASDASSEGLRYPTYEAGRLTQFVTNDGTIIKPEDGIYTARTEEQFNLLNYYVGQDAGLVTPLF